MTLISVDQNIIYLCIFLYVVLENVYINNRESQILRYITIRGNCSVPGNTPENTSQLFELAYVSF